MKTPLNPSSRRRNERGVILMMATASMVAIIPLVGLSIDVGYLYACKTRLQSAVDGASLAAARALVLGQSTSAQATRAQQNAVNWFYANFPTNNWATRNLSMNTGTVQVRDETTDPTDPTLRNVRRVEVRATVDAPSYFMRWFGSRFNYTRISSLGTANRRDVVVMMVLDRSASMTSPLPGNSNGSCDELRAAAKAFTGQFAAGRDRIGMVSYSDGVSPVYIPSQNFRTSLGYTDSAGVSGTGAIDSIVCAGGTGTAAGISIGQRELDRTNLPGALNILLVETDGLPNSLAFNLWDSTRAEPEKSPFKDWGTSTGCGDNRSTPRPRGWSTGSGASQHWGWGVDADRRNWSKSGPSFATFSTAPGEVIPSPYISSGMITTIYSADPSRFTPDPQRGWGTGLTPWHTSSNMGLPNSGLYSTSGTNTITNASVTGCRFAQTVSGSQAYYELSDFKRLPRADLFGNDVKPTNAFDSTVQMVDNNLADSSSSTAPYLKFAACATTGCTDTESTNRWNNYRKAVANATDNAAFRARSGLPGSNNIASTVYVIGLGGQASGPDTPDYRQMQRWANDPRADQFNGSNPLYTAYTMPTSFNSQPRGRLVYSFDFSDLQQAFLEISSQILRLSQ